MDIGNTSIEQKRSWKRILKPEIRDWGSGEAYLTPRDHPNLSSA
jgi:hypothetical protein